MRRLSQQLFELAALQSTDQLLHRERFRLEGRIRALTAQGKLQGWIVGLMPLALGLILNYMRPDLMQPMLHSKFGYALIATILVMEVIGMVMIRRIVAIDV